MSDLALLPKDISTTVDASALDAITKIGDYLPRIQINGSASELAKEGKAPIGTFVLVWSKDRFQDLGKEIDFVSYMFRPKAMRMSGPGGQPISFFNHMHPEFQKIQNDSTLSNSGCMFGPEFLTWLPNPGAFATFFFNNPTMRREAPVLLTLMKREDGTYGPAQASAAIKFIKNTKNSWHGLTIRPHTSPFPAPDAEDWEEQLREQVSKFSKPPESKIETVDANAAANARPR